MVQVTGAVDGSDGSREFMVREEALARLGARVGLSFVRSYSHPALRGVLPRGAGADAALKASPRPARSLRRAAPPPTPSRTNRTRRVPHPVLTGHAASQPATPRAARAGRNGAPLLPRRVRQQGAAIEVGW